jgi:branched-chain amino acid transport system permease protein
LSALLAAGIGWVCLRFRGDYFIFATLGFQMIVFVLLYNWVELGHGQLGLYGVPRPEILGWVVKEAWQYLLFRLYRSPFGLALKTMREDERAAGAMGINTNTLALRAIALAGGVAGLAGALYAGYVTYIDPTSFSLQEAIFIVTLLLLGGSGNIKGPLAGAVVMVALPEVLRFVGLPDTVAANVREIIYGGILAALMYWRPQGLAGTTSIKS